MIGEHIGDRSAVPNAYLLPDASVRSGYPVAYFHSCGLTLKYRYSTLLCAIYKKVTGPIVPVVVWTTYTGSYDTCIQPPARVRLGAWLVAPQKPQRWSRETAAM